MLIDFQIHDYWVGCVDNQVAEIKDFEHFMEYYAMVQEQADEMNHNVTVIGIDTGFTVEVEPDDVLSEQEQETYDMWVHGLECALG